MKEGLPILPVSCCWDPALTPFPRADPPQVPGSQGAGCCDGKAEEGRPGQLPICGMKGFHVHHLLTPLECIAASIAVVQRGHYESYIDVVMSVMGDAQ